MAPIIFLARAITCLRLASRAKVLLENRKSKIENRKSKIRPKTQSEMTALSEKVVLRGLRFGEHRLPAAGLDPAFNVSCGCMADVWRDGREDLCSMAGAYHLPTLSCHAGAP